MSEVNDFKYLKIWHIRIWQKGMDIAKECYFLTQKFPQEELYGMVQQIRSSASSIPANIAEGYARRSSGEYKRFLRVAQGSINKLQTHLFLAKSVGLCEEDNIEFLIREIQSEARLIIALMRKLE
jgi:four helix bundle protein